MHWTSRYVRSWVQRSTWLRCRDGKLCAHLGMQSAVLCRMSHRKPKLVIMWRRYAIWRTTVDDLRSVPVCAVCMPNLVPSTYTARGARPSTGSWHWADYGSGISPIFLLWPAGSACHCTRDQWSPWVVISWTPHHSTAVDGAATPSKRTAPYSHTKGTGRRVTPRRDKQGFFLLSHNGAECLAD